MNPSIFISYSRQDEKQAMHLLGVLRREGYTVWIDQESIAGASIWSDEIVQNIKQCDIFIALLSESSTASHNVSKEIAIAAENRKIILPIEIGTVHLPGQLEYALAGIQRTSYHDEQAILHAIRNLTARMAGETPGSSTLATHRARKQRVRLKVLAGIVAVLLLGGGFFFFNRNSSEKEIASNTVIVLPFATMNLDQDSIRTLDIFSDGIMKRLSPLTTLTSAGPAVSSRYKDSPLTPLSIAKELKVRYIVEGLVRKYQDVDFISVRIFDLKKGGEIWEQFYKGNIRELFDIREKVCGDVYDFLRSTSGEEQELQALEKNAMDYPDNAEANARYATRLIGNDNVRSLDFFQRAIKADSSDESFYIRAGIVADRIKDGGLALKFGKLGVAVAEKKLRLHPDSLNLATTYTIALDVSGQAAAAERIYDSLIMLHPKDVRLNYNAACNFARQGKIDKAFDVLEKLLPIAPAKRGEVRSDPDFDNIRMYPRYVKLMASNP